MTMIKTSALVLGLAGAFALGVWTGPQLTSRVADQELAAEAGSTSAAPRAAAAVVAKVNAVPASEPELHKRLKPVLNPHTDVSSAATGFRDAEQFAAVAHAARNTGAPFQVLKHQVLTEGRTLTAAIRAARPDADAAVEAERARVMARGDVVAIAG